MSTATVSELPLETTSPALRLRRIAAAVRVSFRWLGTNRTLSTEQKQAVGEAYGADSKLLSAGKRILDTRSPAFRQLTSVRSQIAKYWRSITLPYVEPGVRLIRQSDVVVFNQTMDGLRHELAIAERGMARAYDQIKADAQRRLGRLYEPNDYPAQIEGLFGVEWDFVSVEPPNYLMRLAPEVYEQERERVARRFEEAVELAEQGFIAELARLVSHLTQRLRDNGEGERQVFRDSLVGNLSEFFDRFRRLNVRSNDELDRLVEQAKELVRGVTPADLRDSANLRQHVATEMAVVQSQLEGMIVDRPRRSIVRQPRRD
jgi:hypothetical protein